MVIPKAKIPAYRVYILVKVGIQCLLFYSIYFSIFSKCLQIFPNFFWQWRFLRILRVRKPIKKLWRHFSHHWFRWIITKSWVVSDACTILQYILYFMGTGNVFQVEISLQKEILGFSISQQIFLPVSKWIHENSKFLVYGFQNICANPMDL